MADDKQDPVEQPEKKEEAAPPPAEAKKTEPEPMIPKSRFDEVNERAKKAEQEATDLRKAEEDRKRAELSETERLKLENEDKDKKLKALEREKLQRAAADKSGLPLEFADRLLGDTPEAMELDAAKLLAAMPAPVEIKQKRINNTVPSSGDKPFDQMTREEKNAFLYGSGQSGL